jgi:hypothetical protein
MPLHPDCLGLFGTDGTVESYLEWQGARPYFRYDEVYSAVYKKIIGKLSGLKPTTGPPGQAADPAEVNSGAATPGGLLSPWLDIDASVSSYCRQKGCVKPENLDKVISLHIKALEEWIARP